MTGRIVLRDTNASNVIWCDDLNEQRLLMLFHQLQYVYEDIERRYNKIKMTDWNFTKNSAKPFDFSEKRIIWLTAKRCSYQQIIIRPTMITAERENRKRIYILLWSALFQWQTNSPKCIFKRQIISDLYLKLETLRLTG